MKGIGKFLAGLGLFLLAYVLFLPLSVLNFMILVVKGRSGGYFMSSAVNLDRFANYEFRTLFNHTLRKRTGIKFGDFQETISSVLGKNQQDGSLSIAGQCLAWVLDTLDKDHCKKSIKE